MKKEKINKVLPIITAIIVGVINMISQNYFFNKEKSFEVKYEDLEKKTEYYIKTIKTVQEIHNTYIPIMDSICSGLTPIPNRKTVHITDRASEVFNASILFYKDSIDSLIEKILIEEFDDLDCKNVSKETYTKLLCMMNEEIQRDRKAMGL